jgi:uncharacterized protein DUF1737
MNRPLYKVIWGRTFSELEDNVNHVIEEGYEPVGGPFHYDPSNQGRSDLYQAVVIPPPKDYE